MSGEDPHGVRPLTEGRKHNGNRRRKWKVFISRDPTPRRLTHYSANGGKALTGSLFSPLLLWDCFLPMCSGEHIQSLVHPKNWATEGFLHMWAAGFLSSALSSKACLNASHPPPIRHPPFFSPVDKGG